MQKDIKINDLETLFIELKKLLREIPNNQSELLTSSEVMKLLKISRNSFNRMKDEGILPIYQLRGKIYCKLSEVQEIINNCRVN